MRYYPGVWPKMRCAAKTLFVHPGWLFFWSLMPWGFGWLAWQFVLHQHQFHARYFNIFVMRSLPLLLLVIYTTGFVLWGTFIFTLHLLGSLVQPQWILVALTPDGAWNLSDGKQVQNCCFSWDRVWMVFCWKDDVILSGSLEPIIIPREAFVSRGEAREFASSPANSSARAEAFGATNGTSAFSVFNPTTTEHEATRDKPPAKSRE